jgi:nucleotide-binding universal stress UspA family protein
MEEIKRVLVAIDLTDIDEMLIQYVARLDNEIALDKIYFLNVTKNLQLPEDIIKKYPNLVAPMDEMTKKEIQFTINKVVGNQLKSDYEIKVTEGHRAEEILRWIKIKEVDLVVMGRKKGKSGDGIVTNKIVRLAPCSIVLIPEVLPQEVKKLVIPIDYEHASQLAFDFGLYLSSKIPGISITCLNIYEVPSGYHYSGKSYEEFAQIMRHNAEDSFKRFTSKFKLRDTKVHAEYILNKESGIAQKIFDFSVEEGASVIVMGSKGRTQAAALLLGSISEKLIKINDKIPLIVVKERWHNLDFLEALFEV